MTERDTYNELMSYITKEWDRVTRLYEYLGENAWMQIDEAGIHGVLKDIALTTSLTSGNEVITKYGITDVLYYEPDRWSRVVGEYIDTYTAETAKSLSGSMADQYKASVKEYLGRTDFVSKKAEIEYMTSKLSQDIDLLSWKVRRIAVTEHTTALNYGRYKAGEIFQANGVRVKKQWVAHRGARTCHDMAHRQIRGINDPFDVCEPMMFPGDPGGSVSNIVNCRCDMIYLVEDNVDMEAERLKSERAYARALKRQTNKQ